MLNLDETLTSLLNAIDGASPSGPNLDGDPSYIALREQVEPKPSGFVSEHENTVVPWHDVYDQCVDLLGQTKDLNILLWLCRAAFNVHGLVGLAGSLALTQSLLESHWSSLHPPLDHEDDDDPTERINCFLLLNEPTALLQDMRQQAWANSKQGQFVLADYLSSPQQLDEAAAQQHLNTVLAAMDTDEAEALVTAATSIQGSYQAIRDTIEAKVEATMPRFEGFEWLIHKVRALFESTRLGKAHSGAESLADNNAPQSDATSTTALAHIRSRADVIRALDLIIDYYEQQEPSSPIPLLIRRTKKAVNMNFLDVIEEFIPQGLNDARTLMGQEK